MTLLLVHAGVTLTLVGLIWTIQVLHYPLMGGVGGDGFRNYHERHARRIAWLVGPLMPAELLIAGWIAWSPPAGVSPTWAWAGLGLVAAIWAVTAFCSVPAHARLHAGFDATAHRRLVSTNWLRTLAWTARGLLALWMLAAHAG